MKNGKNKKYRFLELLRKIPKGKLTTYKIIGRKAGIGPRQAGYYLKNNDRPDLYPCYKVVKTDGTIGGFSAKGGKNTKKRLLAQDGIKTKNWKVINFEKVLWKF